jgi:predicted PhzF superfamily epimerase YddE/YHI9
VFQGEVKMRIPYFQVDAFTGPGMAGNPAGVCFPESQLPAELMQRVAFENNLSETAFVVPLDSGFQIRWFTPQVEVDLCGHATLASAHVLFNHLGYSGQQIVFSSPSGKLTVEKVDRFLFLDFPSRPPSLCTPHPALLEAFPVQPDIILASVRDYLMVYEEEEVVRKIVPDIGLLKDLDKFGVIVTASGKKADFVSRFFCPGEGIPEDPVTGSSHCTLIPYWSERLNKNDLIAWQVSQRGGRLVCQNLGDRVKIGGEAVTFMQGRIEV